MTSRLFRNKGPVFLAPYMISPYTRIVGKHVYGTPPFFAIVQTDGSYHARKTRVAAIMRPSMINHLQKRVYTVDSVVSSTEAEWHSLLMGLDLALEEGELNVALENDNLGVIHGLITPGTAFRHEYARYYKDQILQRAEKAEYFGARWIPREFNKAVKEQPLA